MLLLPNGDEEPTDAPELRIKCCGCAVNGKSGSAGPLLDKLETDGGTPSKT